MKLFTLSQVCTSQKHCQTCRAQEKGRAWRHSLEKAFELPSDAPDFACPPERGAKPWGYRNPSPPPKTPQGANGARPAPPKPDPSKWPILARAIRWNRQEGDRGVGSTLKRMLGNVGADVIAEWYERITGHPCGCSDRAAKLDALFPY